jgi:MFS superfamily sulfate permease-like transporter
LSYVPNFFYGSLLFMIAMDLIIEWLWEFRKKVTVMEYLVGLSTFALIHWTGVEYGIIAGVAIYAICRYGNIIHNNIGQVKQEQQQVVCTTTNTGQHQNTIQARDHPQHTTNFVYQETKMNGNATTTPAFIDHHHHHLTEREQLLHFHQNRTNPPTTLYSSC